MTFSTLREREQIKFTGHRCVKTARVGVIKEGRMFIETAVPPYLGDGTTFIIPK